MATYATIAEARALYGEDYIAISDDRDAFEESLDRASERIWGIAEPYFPDGQPAAVDAPAFWKMCTIDIAIYFSSAEAGPRTKEKRQRYEDAMEILRDRYPAPEAAETTAPSSSIGATVSAEDRVFTREKMSGLL